MVWLIRFMIDWFMVRHVARLMVWLVVDRLVMRLVVDRLMI